LEDLYRYLIYIFSAFLVLFGGTTKLSDRRLGVALRVLGFVLVLAYSSITIENLFAKVLAISSSAIATLVTIYTTSYAKLKYGFPYLQLLVDAFSLSITFTFASRYLIEFVTCWIIAELIGFVLIAFEWFTQGARGALEAGVRYLLVSMVPADITLFTLVALTGIEKAFTVDIVGLAPAIQGSSILTVLCMIGFLAKAAVAPLHFWLPDAHSLAPAPASAMLSGLMVKMGVYGLYLLAFYPVDVNLYAYMLMVCGSITAIYGGLQALAQVDIKRILAYSTISHTSVMAILLGFSIAFNSAEALQAALFYIVAHAFFKASLFMDSGVVEIIAHTRDIGSLGYISRLYSLESTTALLAILSLIGAPPLPGFIAKFTTILSITNKLSATPPAAILLVVIAIEIALSVGYGAKYLLTHFGSSAIKIAFRERLERLKLLTLPILIAVALSIAFAAYVLLIQLVAYAQITLFIMVISAVFLAIVLYTIYRSQKAFRVDESWLGGARP
jgi:NADH:ubiquinone oxidoreductase subunit 5 (chain L)/Multisubunit Na+/H+ antiporter, MnhA subunit